ncbi:YolD-like family protein [Alteribacter populi]|uniref:YolD-like family protein n=1 Tax=Alteribacter populi TaxID=2011011 RepID=UPI000BBAE529|nr:YolD-like family protein [Alteribacter populi]
MTHRGKFGDGSQWITKDYFDDRLNDRGMVKWQPIMIPEHAALLRKSRSEYGKSPKPELDEQAYEEISRTVAEAMAENRPLTFTYWRDGHTYDITAHCHYCDAQRKEFRLIDSEGNRERLSFDCVISVE